MAKNEKSVCLQRAGSGFIVVEIDTLLYADCPAFRMHFDTYLTSPRKVVSGKQKTWSAHVIT
ncbi:hypothetical protein ACVLD2_002205 [Paenibacillus sp. PvR052]